MLHSAMIARQLERGFGREIVRMQIMRDDLWLGLVELREVRDRTGEGLVCGLGREIAEMLTNEYVSTDAQRHRVFQMRPDGKDARDWAAECDRKRSVTSCAPQNHFPTRD